MKKMCVGWHEEELGAQIVCHTQAHRVLWPVNLPVPTSHCLCQPGSLSGPGGGSGTEMPPVSTPTATPCQSALMAKSAS